MSIPCPSSKYPPVSLLVYEQVVAFDYDKMVERAEEFARGDKSLVAYIQGILQDPGFKKDPKHFLNNWEFRIARSLSFDETERSAHMFILQQPQFHRGAQESKR